MSFDWLHYLDLAAELSEQAGSSKHKDANLRSSISRAYYASYHQTRKHLKDKWGILVPKNADAHGQVRVELRKKKQYSIAKKLNRMRIDRNKADYDDEFADLEGIAQENIWRAKQVLSGLRRL
jgi:hypothetical protein